MAPVQGTGKKCDGTAGKRSVAPIQNTGKKCDGTAGKRSVAPVQGTGSKCDGTAGRRCSLNGSCPLGNKLFFWYYCFHRLDLLAGSVHLCCVHFTFYIRWCMWVRSQYLGPQYLIAVLDACWSYALLWSSIPSIQRCPLVLQIADDCRRHISFESDYLFPRPPEAGGRTARPRIYPGGLRISTRVARIRTLP